MRLLVYFDGQFWTGLIESSEADNYFAKQYIFGVEPSDSEILEFVNNQMFRPLQTAQLPDKQPIAIHRKINPKRLKKLAAREMEKVPVSTKSQAAIQQQFEEQKKEKSVVSKAERDAQKERKRLIAAEKAKNKHRGR